MTEIEFEAKLATVSDAKLRSMLASSRSHGPEIAVKLILSEGKARGLDGLEDDVKKGSEVDEESEEMDVNPSVEAAMAAAASQAIGYTEGSAQEESNPETISENESSEEMPPVGANWLNEENRPNRMPVAVKALVFLAALGALILGALKFIQRG